MQAVLHGYNYKIVKSFTFEEMNILGGSLLDGP